MDKTISHHDWLPFNQPTMNSSQLTDTQLLRVTDNVATEYLATECGHPAHDRLELTYDLLVRELRFRGMWD